jgi:hypothetical protein
MFPDPRETFPHPRETFPDPRETTPGSSEMILDSRVTNPNSET